MSQLDISKEKWYVGSIALGIAPLAIVFPLTLLALNTMGGLSLFGESANVLIPVGAVAWFVTSIFWNVQTRRKRSETLLR